MINSKKTRYNFYCCGYEEMRHSTIVQTQSNLNNNKKKNHKKKVIYPTLDFFKSTTQDLL